MMKTDRCAPVGLYLHVPFCVKKCNYCDFCSFSNLEAGVRKKYIETLIAEIYSYKRDFRIRLDSIFFGGGTPSLLEPDEFSKIYCAVADTFEILPDCEFSLEANPKTLSEEKLRLYTSLGVNRISMGLQSIHENELKKLGRIHGFEDFVASYNLVLQSGITNINVDVMYGIPEQTPGSFEETLRAVIRLNPTHISAYGLILEPGTPFWDMAKSLPLPSEDEECDMYEAAAKLLSESGYTHYEISNYAATGFESRHNLKYWRMRDYIGVGVAAYSCFMGVRYGNSQNLSEYLSENKEEYITREVLDESTSAYEYAMLALRLKEGISLSEYESRFGEDFIKGREEKISAYIDRGYLTLSKERLALTEKGFYVSNTILTDLL